MQQKEAFYIRNNQYRWGRLPPLCEKLANKINLGERKDIMEHVMHSEAETAVAEPGYADTTAQAVESINRQRRQFSATKTADLSAYLERERTTCTSPRLFVLNGWSNSSRPTPNDSLSPQLLYHLLKENNESTVRCGGYWVNMGGLGIVINPGQWFLERFHAAGLHIWDIDHVIVTDCKETASCDIERLWAFNKEINTLLKDWNIAPHVISFWLHPTVFERNVSVIRPVFRQERSTIHRLETFPDISAFETVELNDKLVFDYCVAAPTSTAPSPLMIRFRFVGNQEQVPLGFLSQAPWDEAQNAFLSSCTSLVLGIGETPLEEIAAQSENSSSLGYAGVLKILDNTAARLAIIAEQGFSEGDIRIESLKHLREERTAPMPTILPAEEGTTIFLDSLHVMGNGLDAPTPAPSVRVMRSDGPFSRLTFLNEGSIL
jgi:hypothetical protein